MLKGIEHSRVNDRQDADTAHKIVNDNAELQLQKAQTALAEHNKSEDRAHASFEKAQDRKAKSTPNG
jgi:hypothetical protein